MEKDKIRKNKKRIIFNISEEMHKQIKVRSAIRNTTIRKYILRAVLEKMSQEPLTIKD